MDKDKKFQEILTRAKNDSNIIGLVLTGGRGKNQVTEYSDYDLVIVASDEGKEIAKAEYEKYNSTENIELGVNTLNEFKNKGNWGVEDAWMAYGLTHLKPLIDKTGKVQEILDEKGKIPKEKIKDFVSLNIDGFINQHYRVLKNFRDKNIFAARLDATESVPLLLNILFGREGRVRPYNKFLLWELRNYPLKNLPWSVDEFIQAIGRVLDTGDIETMKDFYRKLRDTSLALGYEEKIKGWDGYVLE